MWTVRRIYTFSFGGWGKSRRDIAKGQLSKKLTDVMCFENTKHLSFKVVLMTVTPWGDQDILENVREYRAQCWLPGLHHCSDLGERLLFFLHNKTSNIYMKI